MSDDEHTSDPASPWNSNACTWSAGGEAMRQVCEWVFLKSDGMHRRTPKQTLIRFAGLLAVERPAFPLAEFTQHHDIALNSVRRAARAYRKAFKP